MKNSNDKTRVLVMGATGMLGTTVAEFLNRQSDLQVITSGRVGCEIEVDVEKSDWFQAVNFAEFDYVINCIGIIKPYCKDTDALGVQRAIRVNAQFPWELSHFTSSTSTKVIQIATDCVFSGDTGSYTESSTHDARDVYGKTKSLGEVFDNQLFLNIRCSIIGPEKKGRLSLLEWFLSQPEGATVNGFTHHDWNGVTTLQFAQLCAEIIASDTLFKKIRGVHHCPHYVPNVRVSKSELLKLFKDAYRRNVTVNATNVGQKIDRTLSSQFLGIFSNYESIPMKRAVNEMADFSF